MSEDATYREKVGRIEREGYGHIEWVCHIERGCVILSGCVV